MSKSPAFQFYAGDYLSDANVAKMTGRQEGAYTRLLAHCWIEGWIDADPAECLKLCKPDHTLEDIGAVQKCFVPMKKNPEKLIHKRLEVERKKKREFIKKQQEKGKRSGEVRRKAREIKEPHDEPRLNHGLTTVEPDGNSSSSSSSSSSVHTSYVEKDKSFSRQVEPATSSLPAHAVGAAEGKPLPVDPLAEFPKLADYFPAIRNFIGSFHPHAKQPNPGTKAWFEERAVLSQLVRVDNFKPEEIEGALEWVFTAEHKDAEFWREQIQSIKGLRKVGPSGMTKFALMCERWHKSTGNGAKPAEKEKNYDNAW